MDRKYLAEYVNAAKSGNAQFVLLGDDLEELNTDLNANVEKKKNILGKSSVRVTSYEAQDSISPFYAEEDNPLFDRLQAIADGRLTGDDCKTQVVDVHLWKLTAANTYEAYKEDAVIEVQSVGGDTTGIQIPFVLHRTGTRTQGTFNILTKEFTANSNDATLGTLGIELIAGTASLKTKVTDVIGENSNSLMYKIGATVKPPVYGEAVTDYTALTLSTDLTCTAKTNKIVVVAVANDVVVAASDVKTVVCP